MTNISSFGSGDLIPQEEKLELKNKQNPCLLVFLKKLHFKKVE